MCAGNKIGGDLIVDGNRAKTLVFAGTLDAASNAVGTDLQCQNNTMLINGRQQHRPPDCRAVQLIAIPRGRNPKSTVQSVFIDSGSGPRGRPPMMTGFLLMQDADQRSKILRAWAGLRKPKRLGASGRLRLMAALMVCIGFASSSKIALAAGATGSQPWMQPVPTLQIFTFLFLMLGPFKVVGPFTKITERAEPRLARSIAVRATLVSSLALVLAAVLGQSTLSKYGIPLPDLALAGGLILFLVALRATLVQSTPSSAAGDEIAVPTLDMAITPLALPTIVTPYGVAAVIIFLALSPDLEARLIIGVILLAIMLLNLIFMLLARHIHRFLGPFLQILGAVLGIVQVALGIRFIDHALKWLWSS